MITIQQLITFGIITLIISYTAGWFGFNLRNREVSRMKRYLAELEDELENKMRSKEYPMWK